MIKYLFFLLLSIVWFGLAGVFIADRTGIVNWGGSFLLYSMGFYWIYPYIFSKAMFFPYSGEPIIEKKENSGKRITLLLAGLIFSGLISIL